MDKFSAIAAIVFLVTLVMTFVVSTMGARHSKKFGSDALDGRGLNRWLVGLSAGATANSGFVVTAAVGLGYTYGLVWVLLPLSWLLGDLLFWRLFPQKINEFGRRTGVATISQLLTFGLTGRAATRVSVLAGVVVVIFLSGYTSAQWLAGQKFMSGAFGVPGHLALLAFAILIVAYTAIGGFRGSVYADTFQAVIRLVSTVLAMAGIAYVITGDIPTFQRNIDAAGPGFLSPFPEGGVAHTVLFVVGFAAAAVGFGLGQPQLLSRYLAGADPEETRAAKWIYISFVQFTWIAMTVFGILLKGVIPDLKDPEIGLSTFFHDRFGAIVTGIIAADIFATIASTSNSLVVAIAQSLKYDVLPILSTSLAKRASFATVCLAVGAITMVVSMVIGGSVLTLALGSISIMGAALASPVLVRILRWPHSAASLLAAILAGLIAAIAWRLCGFAAVLNETIIGMAVGSVTNFIVAKQAKSTTHS